MAENLPFGLDSLVQNVSKINLKGGLASKICYVLICVALAMALISWSVKIVWVSAMALGLIFLLVFTFLWRLVNLAERNPQSALMEGGELLIHQQMLIGQKGQPNITVSPQEVALSSPISLTQEDIKLLNQPEEENSSNDEGRN